MLFILLQDENGEEQMVVVLCCEPPEEQQNSTQQNFAQNTVEIKVEDQAPAEREPKIHKCQVIQRIHCFKACPLDFIAY